MLVSFSSFSVKSFVYFAQLAIGDMSIDLRGGDAGMSEHGLHRADIGAIYQKIGCKGMAQGMRCDFLGDAGANSVFFYHSFDAAGSKLSWRGFVFWNADKHCLVRICPAAEVIFDRFARLSGSKNRADLAAFAADAEFVFFQIHIRALEIGEFGNAEPGRKKKFQNRSVAEHPQAIA